MEFWPIEFCQNWTFTLRNRNQWEFEQFWISEIWKNWNFCLQLTVYIWDTVLGMHSIIKSHISSKKWSPEARIFKWVLVHLLWGSFSDLHRKKSATERIEAATTITKQDGLSSENLRRPLFGQIDSAPPFDDQR